MFETVYLISDTARLLRKSFDARVKQLGMTSTQARLLLILSRSEGENQAYYAEALEVEAISLTRLIDRMEEGGLIERRRDPADRRAWRLSLTKRSRETIDRIRESLAGLEDEMLTGLDTAQRQTLESLLLSIRENFASPRLLPETVNG